ncbi:MAG: hypothetical protein IJF73_03090 [Clostridia bacterium]|nr:hypothetical protein [Clostridia bacterium]MBQ4065900.1 hypothetical protein [Clostridia bacterium]
MKKLTVYYGAHIAINMVSLVAFPLYIQVHSLSLVPIFLIALMLFQIMLFKEDTRKNDISETAYPVGKMIRLTEEEQACQYVYLKHSFLLCIPFELPLIFFLSSYWKLIGLAPYILAYIIGGVLFRSKKGKEIQERINKEKKELEEQIRREQLGLK